MTWQAYIPWIVMGAFLLVCLIATHKRPRINRYRRNPPLPPPSPRCQRGLDWRAHVSTTRF